MELISMVDFVLLGWNDNSINIRYANFLKQPLEIWMFVPCKLVDGVWVVLKEPENHIDWLNWKASLPSDCTKGFIKNEEYQQAKERCLFEGYRITEHAKGDFSIIDESGFINPMWKFNMETYWRKSRGLFTIEDLVKYKPTLTATALKIIGL